MITNHKCQWPGCYVDALCQSGNVGGALVCSTHFKITNGNKRTAEQEEIMKLLATIEEMKERWGDA